MPEEWNKLSGPAKKKILETISKEPALVATPSPNDSWSWRAAQECVDEMLLDLDLWGGVGLQKMQIGGI